METKTKSEILLDEIKILMDGIKSILENDGDFNEAIKMNKLANEKMHQVTELAGF